MNRDELKAILPHREPMLLLDVAEVTMREGEQVALGRYHVNGDEFFLQGHFPGKPVVPGVILCEIMAQTCCVLMEQHPDMQMGKTPYYTGLNNVKFKAQVHPGDTIQMECIITRSKAPFFFAKGVGMVNGKTCISGEFSFALLDA